MEHGGTVRQKSVDGVSRATSGSGEIPCRVAGVTFIVPCHMSPQVHTQGETVHKSTHRERLLLLVYIHTPLTEEFRVTSLSQRTTAKHSHTSLSEIGDLLEVRSTPLS